MIGSLKGFVEFSGINHFIINVSGVGYKVFATLDTIRALGGKNEAVTVWTYLAVRENALDLYGFSERAELELFELLVTIPGIGPKSALGILSVASPDTLKNAISSGDSSYLTKVSGIGKKNAEKIIVELRDKLGSIVNIDEADVSLKKETEALAALEALGYSLRDARDALKDVGDGTTEEKLKQALKKLSS